MKKVFIIHGYHGFPNGAWRPWLMAELEKKGVYACALPMPGFDNPVCKEWVEGIKRNIENDISDEIYLVGHSLGVTAILRYLENTSQNNLILGAVLVSGPIQKTQNRTSDNFLEDPFNFQTIGSKVKRFVIIHGDDDPYVPIVNAEILSKELEGKLIVISNGGHLNGSGGWLSLQPCLDSLTEMMNLNSDSKP